MYILKSKTIINFAYSEGSGGGGDKIVIPDGWTQEDKTVTTIDTSNWDTSNMTTMNSMFSGCDKLSSLNVSNFNTSNVTNMGSMFSGCGYIDTSTTRPGEHAISGLKSINTENWDTSNVTNMSYMFYDCYALEGSGIVLDTSKVTNMSHMFENCISMGEYPVQSFDTSKVEDMSYMFYNDGSTGIHPNDYEIDLSNFDTRNLKNMYCMFNKYQHSILLSSKFFNSQYLTTYDFSSAENWNNTSGIKYNFTIDTMIEALPTITTAKTLKFSQNTGNDLTDTQKASIKAKGWTIEIATVSVSY